MVYHVSLLAVSARLDALGAVQPWFHNRLFGTRGAERARVVGCGRSCLAYSFARLVDELPRRGAQRFWAALSQQSSVRSSPHLRSPLTLAFGEHRGVV
jgi:hypothetical protein